MNWCCSLRWLFDAMLNLFKNNLPMSLVDRLTSVFGGGIKLLQFTAVRILFFVAVLFTKLY